MPDYLLVLEAHSSAPQYEPLLDVLERRLGARRILRTAWVVAAASPSAIREGIRMWLPVSDGLVIVGYGEPRIEVNLRGTRKPIAWPAPVGDQETPK